MSAHPDMTLPVTPLRAWRNASGVSYAELGRRTSLPLRTIMAIAAGRTPTPENAERIVRATRDLSALGRGHAIGLRTLLGLPEDAVQEATATAAARAVSLSQAGAARRRRGVDVR